MEYLHGLVTKMKKKKKKRKRKKEKTWNCHSKLFSLLFRSIVAEGRLRKDFHKWQKVEIGLVNLI